MATPTELVRAIFNSDESLRATAEQMNLRLENASIKEILIPIISDPLTLNKFLTRLYNKFILTEVINGRFRNPLEPLKKGSLLPYGDTIERMIFNPAKAISYYNKDDNILTPAPPDVHVEYIRVTRQDKYPISLPRPVIQQAFSSESNFSEFLTGAMNSLYNGDAIDEYTLMKKIISDSFDKGYLLYTEVGDTSKDTTAQLINAHKWFTRPSSQYNAYSRHYADDPVVTWCDPENVVIVCLMDFLTDIKLDYLANAFNLSEVELTSNIIEVESFPIDGIKAIICDRAFFQARDTLYELAEFFRADDLSTKTYLHHWQTMTCSLFANALVLVDKGVTPSTPMPEPADPEQP